MELCGSGGNPTVSSEGPNRGTLKTSPNTSHWMVTSGGVGMELAEIRSVRDLFPSNSLGSVKGTPVPTQLMCGDEVPLSVSHTLQGIK